MALASDRSSYLTTTSSCVRRCCSRPDRVPRPAAGRRRPTESERSRTWQSRGCTGAPASSTTRWSRRWWPAARRREQGMPAASCSRRRWVRQAPCRRRPGWPATETTDQDAAVSGTWRWAEYDRRAACMCVEYVDRWPTGDRQTGRDRRLSTRSRQVVVPHRRRPPGFYHRHLLSDCGAQFITFYLHCALYLCLPTLTNFNQVVSTQPCIPPGPLNRVPASAGVKVEKSLLPGGNTVWSHMASFWHVISRSGVVKFTNCYTLFTLLL